MKEKIKAILKILLKRDEKPKAYWIRIPAKFHTDKERHEFVQQTINFVNKKTTTQTTTVIYEAIN